MIQSLKLKLASAIRALNSFRWLMVYMSLVGLVTFPLFIHEEAIQTTMFGTWQAGPADRWDIVNNGVDIMEKINLSMKIINYTLGWINPLSFLSYRAYGQATDSYIEASRARIMKKDPRLMVGIKTDVAITPKRMQRLEDGSWFVSDDVNSVITSNPPEFGHSIQVKGTYVLIDGRLTIKED